MSTNTVFTLRVILSTAFRKKASGLSDAADEAQIDQAKVSTQVKLTMAAVNDAYLNQASVFLQVAEMVNLPQSDSSDLNSCIALWIAATTTSPPSLTPSWAVKNLASMVLLMLAGPAQIGPVRCLFGVLCNLGRPLHMKLAINSQYPPF